MEHDIYAVKIRKKYKKKIQIMTINVEKVNFAPYKYMDVRNDERN